MFVSKRTRVKVGPLPQVFGWTVRECWESLVVALPATQARNAAPPVAKHPTFHLSNPGRSKESSIARLHNEALRVVRGEEKDVTHILGVVSLGNGIALKVEVVQETECVPLKRFLATNT